MDMPQLSSLLIAAAGVVVALLAVPRQTQLWALPLTGVVLLVLVLLPLRQLDGRREWLISDALFILTVAFGGWRLVVWLMCRPPAPIEFFDVDSISDGAVVHDADVPLTITGTYRGNARGIRVILQDADGQHYLQHPEVELGASGGWTARNIRPGKRITKILFTQLGRMSKKRFAAMAATNQWGSFGRELPPNVRLLSSIGVERRS